MNVYIGSKKVDGKYKYGITIYSDNGSILYSRVMHDQLLENKFDNPVNALLWGIKKLKTLTQNKSISSEENILLFIGSKTLYTWFEKEVAPEPYTSNFSSIMLEASFILNRVEIMFSKNVDKKVVYRNSDSDVEKPVKITELFSL